MVAVPLTGVDGYIEIDSTAVESIREWDMNGDSKVVAVGGFGTKFERNKPAVIAITGSIKGVYATGAAGQLALQNAWKNQTLVDLTLGAAVGEQWVIPAYITKLMNHPQYDDIVEYSADWAADGEPTTYPGH